MRARSAHVLIIGAACAMFVSMTNRGGNVKFVAWTEDCKVSAVEHHSVDVLPPSAYTRDRNISLANVIIGSLAREPPVFLAIPRMFENKIDRESGELLQIGNSDNIYEIAKSANPKDGIFIDVGGWVGDSAFPSAALGLDTYVFDPVRWNTNLMHASKVFNTCFLSQHLTIVNALVADFDGLANIYVTKRTDNTAATEEQATRNVGKAKGDRQERVNVIRLDSFFPLGTKVQNIKVDVQGSELLVMRGAQRLLRENRGNCRVRLEVDEGLLSKANTTKDELLDFMLEIGYKVVRSGNDYDFA